MLSVGKLAAGPDAGRYYEDAVAQGREDYYAGEGEAPGQWVGSGAASLAACRARSAQARSARCWPVRIRPTVRCSVARSRRAVLPVSI